MKMCCFKNVSTFPLYLQRISPECATQNFHSTQQPFYRIVSYLLLIRSQRPFLSLHPHMQCVFSISVALTVFLCFHHLIMMWFSFSVYHIWDALGYWWFPLITSNSGTSVILSSIFLFSSRPTFETLAADIWCCLSKGCHSGLRIPNYCLLAQFSFKILENIYGSYFIIIPC